MTQARMIPHPGHACCDLTQDLPGWITRQRQRLNTQLRWARVLSQRGQRLRREAITAQVRGNTTRATDLDIEAIRCCGQAWVIHQSAAGWLAHLDRLAASHQWRPDMTGGA